MVLRIGFLHTPTINSLPGETGMPTCCVPDGTWLISKTLQKFSRKEIFLVTIFIDVYMSRIGVICTIFTV